MLSLVYGRAVKLKVLGSECVCVCVRLRLVVPPGLWTAATKTHAAQSLSY